MASELLRSLDRSAEAFGDRPALVAPDGGALTYSAVRQALAVRHQSLQQAGIGALSRVAIQVPNGLDAALDMLAIITHAVCVPLNPSIGEIDLRDQLTACRVDALLCPSDAQVFVPTVLAELAVRPITVSPAGARNPDPWRIGPAPRSLNARSAHPRHSAPGTALVLQTSGTTGLPKRVPLSQANLVAAAQAIADQLALGPSDRTLNMLPLFHVHGLVGSLLASLLSGGSVICTAGFSHAHFTTWLATLRPTWYTAAPAIHLAALQAMQDAAAGPPAGLRLIRSASSPLAPATIAQLENCFGVPVIEAYGATEASSPISSNPLPPATRKAGSVGLPCCAQIKLIDADGNQVKDGDCGQIAVRGPGLMAGYEPDPLDPSPDARGDPHALGVVDGWWPTGDLGRLDADGYLYIVGRLKDQVNRGGEKLSPREIDDALMAIEGVRQAASFAVAHPSLGEDLAAAVVVAPGSPITEASIRASLQSRLGPHKVPTRIHFVDVLPRNVNGKIQRHELSARRWPSDGDPGDTALASDALFAQVQGLWQSVLGGPLAPAAADFFQSGGDSLQAARMIARLNTDHDLALPVSALFRHRTVAQITALVRESLTGREAVSPGTTGARDSPPAVDLDALASDIEALSDEEVERELAAMEATNNTA